MRPSLVGMVILVGGRWDGLGAESAASSALDEAIGVAQVLGCYIVLSATKPVLATSTSHFVDPRQGGV